MKMTEIIERVSEIYRDERRKISDLYDERNSILTRLCKAEKECWRTITEAECRSLERRNKSLKDEIEIKEAYCAGISCVREMLMDLGFNTEAK